MLLKAVEECIRQLAQEYYDLPTEMIIITVVHILSTMPGVEFADKRRTIRTMILEAMMTPAWEMNGMFMQARTEGKPPRRYQTAMVAARFSMWHGHGVTNFGPLSPDPVNYWIALKDAVVQLICRQVVQKVTFAAALEDFKNGKWAQREHQTVAEFEGEFIDKTDILRAACEYDGKEQATSMPCADEIQRLFISKISATVKQGAHSMLANRTADILMQESLEYANCRFEDLHYGHFMRVITVAEDIIIKTAATKRGNLGDTSAKPRYDRNQGRDYDRGSERNTHLPAGNGTRWQKQERSKEIRTNATVASAGDIIDLQKCVGDYQNTTKFFTSKNKVWCAPIREHAEGVCGHCNKKHWLDTLCNGGDAGKLVDASERHSLCPKEMATDMNNGAFKRLTFRFQGGSGGLPKAKSNSEATTATLKVTTALGSTKKTLSTAQQARKTKALEKRKAKKVAAKAAEAAAVTEEEADEEDLSDDSDLENQ